MSHLVSAGSALWKMTHVFLAAGPEGRAAPLSRLQTGGAAGRAQNHAFPLWTAAAGYEIGNVP